MTQKEKKRIAFVSSYLPRKCGIATFTKDLIDAAVISSGGGFEPLVVAMCKGHETFQYDDPVKFEIRQNTKNDYIAAANYLNFSHVDAVSIQHEFGLFGGEAGQYLMLLLDRLKAPIITTLHTILDCPSDNYRQTLIEVCEKSHKVIVMNQYGIELLKEVYGVDKHKIELIPHGIPDLPFVDSSYYKHKFSMDNRKTILTFGLLSQNKSIETMIKAMPEIVAADSSVLYVVLGMTHPQILKDQGESYRFGLHQLVKKLKVQDHVIFYNQFVKDEQLHNFLCASDIYVTPYKNRQQLTSGTLSFAVGTGKAVVSTPYWAAEELLADGRGRIFDFGDSRQLAEIIINILQDESLFYSLRRKAYDYGRSKIWPKIGETYWKLFNTPSLPICANDTISISTGISMTTLPEPSLTHIKRLTDDVGIFQHAVCTVPDRTFGYCTDDNARALLAVVEHYQHFQQPQSIDLFDLYLSFVIHSQNSDGTVKNFMNFDRNWRQQEPVNDTLGRVLSALGAAIANPPSPAYISLLKEAFDKSVKHVEKQFPRSMAHSIVGMALYLKQFPGASDIKRTLKAAADQLLNLYVENSDKTWQWFEDIMAYENAVLPQAMYVAATIFNDQKYLEVAQQSCDFLIKTIFGGDHFSFIGCNGWYEQGHKKAQYDQQPIEAASTIVMLQQAYETTGKRSYLELKHNAFDWFLGKNDLQIPVYNFQSHGCHDGLCRQGINLNQGAESSLCFLLSCISMIKDYPLIINKSANPMSSADDDKPKRQIESIEPSRQQNRKTETEIDKDLAF